MRAIEALGCDRCWAEAPEGAAPGGPHVVNGTACGSWILGARIMLHNGNVDPLAEALDAAIPKGTPVPLVLAALRLLRNQALIGTSADRAKIVMMVERSIDDLFPDLVRH